MSIKTLWNSIKLGSPANVTNLTTGSPNGTSGTNLTSGSSPGNAYLPWPPQGTTGSTHGATWTWRTAHPLLNVLQQHFELSTLTTCPRCLRSAENNVLVIKNKQGNVIWIGCNCCLEKLVSQMSSQVTLLDRYLVMKNTLFRLVSYTGHILGLKAKKDPVLRSILDDAQSIIDR